MADQQRAAPLHAALDALIERFGGEPWTAEVVRAREQYADRTGRVFEDDELYEERTASFLEWYVVERPLDAHGVAPAVFAHRETPDDALAAWARSHRSLFSIEELGRGRVIVDDLLGGGVFEVEEPRKLAGVSLGDLVEARLVGYAGAVRFGRTFLYHPAGARDALLGHAARLHEQGKTRGEIVDFAATLRVRALRYKHVAAERVYEHGMAEPK